MPPPPPAVAVAAASPPSAARQASRLRALGRMAREQPLGAMGVIVLAVMAIVAIGAPYIAPFDPTQGDAAALSSPPNAGNWLGTAAFRGGHPSPPLFRA